MREIIADFCRRHGAAIAFFFPYIVLFLVLSAIQVGHWTGYLP